MVAPKTQDRSSREQESRESDVIHDEYDDQWEAQELLDTSKIPPKPGYVQRWVRTMIEGTEDFSNLSRKMNQGWRPRPADSIPKGAYVPTIKHNRQSVVGVQGMILMERPEKLHQAHARSIRRATKDQMRAVDESMFKVHNPRSGMGAPERYEDSSSVSRGRPVKVDDDD